MQSIKQVLVLSILLTGILLFSGCKNTSDDVKPFPDVVFPCKDGLAANIYPCKNIGMYAHLSPSKLYGEAMNDIWGWIDPVTQKVYALAGMTDGVMFVDITDPVNPVIVGKLYESSLNKRFKAMYSDFITACDLGIGNTSYAKTIQKGSAWRDMKVFKDYLFVVKDYSSRNPQPHGMQVFDLKNLRSFNGNFIIFSTDALYDRIGNAHNIVINEQTGFAYAVGVFDADTCNTTGLHMIDINNPTEPKFAGCYADPEPPTYHNTPAGYIHDAQCVIYNGPDTDYSGHEVCFNAAEAAMVIADVTDKNSPFTIGYQSQPNMYYAHQGWLTEDQSYFLMNDELDEVNLGRNTKTYIFDVRDLDNPVFVDYFEHNTVSIDHNLYVKNNYVFETNYLSGLRVLDGRDVASGNLKLSAFFDTHPEVLDADEEATFDGTWSSYPFYDHGVVAVNDITSGLFILKTELE